MEFSEDEYPLIADILGVPSAYTYEKLKNATIGLDRRKLVTFLGDRIFESDGIQYFLTTDHRLFRHVASNKLVSCHHEKDDICHGFSNMCLSDAIKIIDAANNSGLMDDVEILVGDPSATTLPRSRYAEE